MADLRGALEPAPSNGNGNGNGNASARPRPAHAAAGSPSGIRSPRMILQERTAREAARRAEQEQIQMERNRFEQEQLRMQRARAEEEARVLEDAQMRSADRRAAASAAAAGGSRNPQPQQLQQQGSTTDNLASSSMDPPRRRVEQPSTPERGSSRVHQTSQAQQARPGRATETSAHGQQYPTSGAAAGPSSSHHHRQQQSGGQTPGAPQPTTGTKQSSQAQTQQPQRTSFPHAFERWESLSAQWEGLTSHWIRRLELNASAFDADPVSQQLSRQVTDLSAAGANLFHAVVELQRLRASSERKFQRWFFETRAELERAHEVNGMLEAEVEKLNAQTGARESEARARAQSERDSAANALIQKQLGEMKKELAISKEEARRAWEELGRREQEERERTMSLQAGHPTIVGGVQVVPMVRDQFAPSRSHSTRDQQHGGGVPGSSGGGGYGDYPQMPAGHPVTTTPPEQGYYQPADMNVSQPGRAHQQHHGSEGGYSEEDYETPTTEAGSYAAATSGDSQWAASYSAPQDYTGAGYGAGWESVPRHHHPTRLSDVLEEEESRASTSQVSRA